MTYLLFAIGILGLFFGGEYLVRGASSIARRFGISPLVIGLTIVGFGTSAPELLVSVNAALAGQPGISIGNVLGSNIANVLLILGVSATIAALIIPARRLVRDLAIMLLGTGMVWVMLLDGVISRLEGGILVAGLAGFLYLAFASGSVPQEDDPLETSIGKAALMIVFGLAALVIGANLLVNSASTMARAFGVSEAVIGLTVVAVGTSLPELATSVIAAFRRQTDIAVGNVVGSNIFNLLGILGITALITPIPAEARFASIDMPWVAATAVGLSVLAVWLGGLPRVAGVMLLVIYGGYIALMG